MTSSTLQDERETPPVSAVEQVRVFYEQIWNRADLDRIPTVLHPDVTFRGSLGTDHRGHAEFIDYMGSVTGALSSYRCEIRELVADGDVVAARMEFSGRHSGVLLGREPTGRRVTWAGAAFFHFDGALVRDIWVLGDLDALRAQLDRVW
jgi:predicted ester cyclase